MSHPSGAKRTAKRLSTLSVIVASGLLSVVGSGCGGGGGDGGGAGGGPRPGACTTVTDIASSSTTSGALTADDCTIEGLFPGAGDTSFVDQYRITLPSRGRLIIRLDSGQFDSFLILLNSALQLPPIAEDDDSGGNLNALIEVDLDAGTYIILANSATSSGVTGAYTLTSAFTAAIWVPTSATGAPEARSEHPAVWTGSEMIIWGGHGDFQVAKNTGARFDPATNTWTPIATAGAPTARLLHTAVWTGTEMIVWGGHSGAVAFQALNDGARYNPQTDTWTPIGTANAPSARMNHRAVWSGTEMIVWGGFSSSDVGIAGGARYNPATDTWTPVATTNEPSARGNHSAVWTGSNMIVWGGQNGTTRTDTGGIYDPASDSWVSTSLTAVPAARAGAAAVWTGSVMIVFGGETSDGTGGLFDPTSNSWTSTNTVGAPIFVITTMPPAVWTGTEMIVWGDAGGRYNPVTDSWSGISTVNAPSPRTRHSLAWSGTVMIAWGGVFGGFLDTGGIYNPSVDATP